MHRAKVVLAITAVALIGAAGGGYAWLMGAPVRATEAAVRKRLLDPESARFSDVTFNPAKRVGCGAVNAKNRLGGYVGATRFILFEDGDLRYEPSDDTADQTGELAQKRAGFQTMFDGYCERPR